MHRILGEERGNSGEAERLYAEGSPTARHPVVTLNTSCELVHLYLFVYFLIK
jgi:hypothetical protein